MATVLSVDWDYFITAASGEKHDLFPDGGNESLPAYVQSVIWKSNYASSKVKQELYGDKSLLDLGVDEAEIKALIALITCNIKNSTTFSVAESHKEIVKQLPVNCSVINIDFHHDCFTLGNDIDCGNWVRLKVEDKTIKRLTWVGCKDSEDSDAGCNVIRDRHTRILDLSLNECIDHIFMCRSGMWSPPHLDDKFIDTVLRIDDIVDTESGAEGLCQMARRWDRHIELDIESLTKQMLESHSSFNKERT